MGCIFACLGEMRASVASHTFAQQTPNAVRCMHALLYIMSDIWRVCEQCKLSCCELLFERHSYLLTANVT